MIDALPDDVILGYSQVYADHLANEFFDPTVWRGQRVHILDRSPPKQLDAIRQLTCPTLTDESPADISESIGTDYIVAYSSVSSGLPAAGTTAVATSTTSPSERPRTTESCKSRAGHLHRVQG